MSWFKNNYAADGKADRLAVREAAGHRCIRCLHPFESGNHGKGEWSPCDEQCTHMGPIREIGKTEPGWNPNSCSGHLMRTHGTKLEAQWRVLTVHHFDGDKANDEWWNKMALCQRCHLQIQTKVIPEIPYFFEHSGWMKPYVAGFYAFKYEGKNITREEAIQRMDELLSYEQIPQS
jgi:hypothetical protein